MQQAKSDTKAAIYTLRHHLCSSGISSLIYQKLVDEVVKAVLAQASTSSERNRFLADDNMSASSDALKATLASTSTATKSIRRKPPSTSSEMVEQV